MPKRDKANQWTRFLETVADQPPETIPLTRISRFLLSGEKTIDKEAQKRALAAFVRAYLQDDPEIQELLQSIHELRVFTNAVELVKKEEPDLGERIGLASMNAYYHKKAELQDRIDKIRHRREVADKIEFLEKMERALEGLGSPAETYQLPAIRVASKRQSKSKAAVGR